MDLEVQALTCPKVGLERGPQGARELLRKQIFDPRPSDFIHRGPKRGEEERAFAGVTAAVL